MDDELDENGAVDATIHDGDPNAPLYSCPHCGLERPAVDFLTQDGQSYNPYCSVCMAGYAEALGLQEHQQQHSHGEVTLAGDSLGHEADALQLQQHHHHSQLNVHQLLAAQVVDANLAADHDAATGGMLRHHHHHHDSVLGAHSGHHHSHHEQLLLAQAGELGDADAIAAYHNVHAAALGYAVTSPGGNDLSGVEGLPEGTKKCTKCKLHKLLEEFPLLKARHKGRAAHCFACRSASASTGRLQGMSGGASDASADILDALTMHLQHPSSLPEGYAPIVLEKRCGQCSLVKPATAFRRTRNKTDHLQSRCRECEQALGRGTKRTAEDVQGVKVTRKLCIHCGLDKFASEFFTSKKALDGLYTYCKPCHKELNRQSREKQQSVPVVPPPPTKLCGMCKKEKPSEQFYKGRMSNDGLYTYCKTCTTKMDTKRKREYRQRRKAAQAADNSGGGGGGGAVGEDRTYDNIPELAELAAEAAAAGQQGGEGIGIGMTAGGMQYTNAHQRYHTDDPNNSLLQQAATGGFEGYTAPPPTSINGHNAYGTEQYLQHEQYPQHEQYQYDEATAVAAAAEAAVAAGYDPASVMHYAGPDQSQYYHQQLYAAAQHNHHHVEGCVESYVDEDASGGGGGGDGATEVDPNNGSSVFVTVGMAGVEAAALGDPLAPEVRGDGSLAAHMHLEKRLRREFDRDR